MSDSEDRPRREVAYRVFAAEFEDATHSYSESDEERAPNYVVTPTGLRVNRLFVVGVLTETEQVSDEVLRARVVDPTGAFVAYAGQYQPDALSFLQRTDSPAFVALTGKARTFTPEDSDRTYTSIRPESLNEVDADTRDRWAVRTAEHALARVSAFADALGRPERGADLEATLRAEGVDPALAAGIPRAIEEYGTTTGYLDAIRRLAADAAAVVAGEREEVRSVEFAPDEGGETAVADFELDAGVRTVVEHAADAVEPTTAESETTDAAETAVEPDAETEPDTTETEPETESVSIEGPGDFDAGDGSDAQSVDPDSTTGTEGAEPAPDAESDIEGSPDPESAPDPEPDAAGESAPDLDTGAGDLVESEPAPEEDDSGELYEFGEEERAEVEEEHGLEFSTGSEVEPAEDLDAPEPEEATEPDDDAETEADAAPESVDDEPEDGEESAGSLEDAVVERMEELADGGAADREALVESVVDERGVTPEDVEDAIQDALMSGRCYESGDGEITPI